MTAGRKPSAFGTQSAIVVGADGSDSPNGADELYCDRLGRVRIRFHWQDSMSGDATCWVRVAQRLAGGGMGSQFLPRIGQEVLVQFIENDIDRPIIVGALYNGQGEGGIAPTPGGVVSSESDASCFAPAHDRGPSGRAILLVATARYGMARRPTAPGIAMRGAVGCAQQGVWRLWL
jgi:type VI secretion system secreted protein VgrG